MEEKKVEQQSGRGILGVVSDIVLIILIILAIIITVMTFTSKSSDIGVGNILGYIPFSVKTDSMEPTIGEGDLIISKEIKDPQAEVKEGDVITFYTLLVDSEGNTRRGFNTHRVKDIEYDKDGTVFYYVTKGDGVTSEDNQVVYPDEVVAKQLGASVDASGKYVKGFTVKSIGKALDFLQTRTGFMICIIIPLALFFIWQVYRLLAMFMAVKADKLSDAAKQQAIEEYLASQNNNNTSDDNTDNS